MAMNTDYFVRTVNRVWDDGGNQISKKLIECMGTSYQSQAAMLDQVQEWEARGYVRIIKGFVACSSDDVYAVLLTRIPDVT